MRVLILSTSRADRNLFAPLDAALRAAGDTVIYNPDQPADVAVALGDRVEMLCAAHRQIARGLPLAHIAGGEVTLGSLDDRYRYAISALADVHFVSLPQYVDNLWERGITKRVHIVGSLSLDAIAVAKAKLGSERGGHGWLITTHPETVGDRTPLHVGVLRKALGLAGRKFTVWTASCNDPGKGIIDETGRDIGDIFYHEAGPDFYRHMAEADVMVGNSSAGITEAASFGLPVVNIGIRQHGRIMQPNIINVPWNATRIAGAIKRATAPGFRERFASEKNIYGDGKTAGRIVKVLRRMYER